MARINQLKRKWAFLISTLLLLLGGWYMESREVKSSGERIGALRNNQVRILSANEIQYKKLLADTALININRIKAFDPEIANTWNKHNLFLLVYLGDSLVYWSDNHISVDSCLGDIQMGASIIRTRNGYFQVYKEFKNDYNYLCLYLLKKEYARQNQYLQNHFNPDFGVSEMAEISTHPQKGFMDIQDSRGKYLFSERLYEGKTTEPMWLIIVLGCLLLCYLFAFELLISEYVIRKHYVWVFIFSSFFLILFRLGALYFKFPAFLYDLPLFSSSIYASNVLFPSLGDYLVNIFIISRTFYLVYSALPERTSSISHIRKIIENIIGISLIAASLYLTGRGIASLILDSRITLDINNKAINIYSLLGMLATASIVITQLIFARLVFSTLGWKNLKSGFISYWVIGVIGIIYILLYIIFSFNIAAFVILYTLLQCLLLARLIRASAFVQTLGGLVMAAIFFSVLFFEYNQLKEQEIRRIFAGNVIDQTDYRSERIFPEIDRHLLNDHLIEKYFNYKDLKRKYLQERLIKKYFTGYLNRYDISFIDYENDERSGIDLANKMPLADITEVYEHETTPIANTSFARVNIPSSIQGYIARYKIGNNEPHKGTLFILLQPKPMQDEYNFSEILAESNKHDYAETYEYSWAVYKDEKLYRSHGNYSYPISIDKKEFNTSNHGYSHILIEETPKVSVMVSRQEGGFIKPLAFLSFFITLFVLAFVARILIGFLGYSIYYSFRSHRKMLTYKLYISKALQHDRFFGGVNFQLMGNKILLALTSMVMLTLIITAVVTENTITNLYNEKQIEKLGKKARSVTIEIENIITLGNGKYSADSLNAVMNLISENNSADINLFDLDGNQLVSTQQKVFDLGIISNRMDADAYRALKIEGQSQFFKNEKLGYLEYLSAYVPVFEKNKVVAFINVPFFRKQEELNAEIKANLITLANPYALIFILVGLFAWLIASRFTNQLEIIRQSLSKTTIGRKNKKLHYDTNDEIGELVGQYNIMIDKLSESAEKLVKTERDHAWREMAKQVAHEIKNPLTPMKLNIQQLQRAAKDNRPNLEESIQKVSTLLIEQIDALAQLATEFSNFAKMPESKEESVNICEAIERVIDLFNDTENIQFQFNKPSAPIFIMIDKDEINRVLTNLVKNAIQAIPEHSEGYIYFDTFCDAENNQVTISITDNGCGISAETQSHIFEPNFSTKTSGMGLGLAMVKKIIDHAGGEISFTSELDKGTCFLLKFNTDYT
jgi:signal transduction histidine kinase